MFPESKWQDAQSEDKAKQTSRRPYGIRPVCAKRFGVPALRRL